MRLSKMFGLAAMAALAIMAFGSVGTASALEQKTVLCDAAPNAEGVCTGGVYGENTEISAQSSNTKLKVAFGGGTLSVTCEESQVEGKITSENGKGQPQLKGTITKLTFEKNCKDSLGRNCTVETLQTPYETSLLQDKASPGNGTLTVAETGTNGQPGARVKCPGIISPVDCIYKVAETDEQFPGKEVAHLRVTGGKPATVKAEQVQLKQIIPAGGNCPGNTPKWDGTYTVHKPIQEGVAKAWVAHVFQ